MGDQPIDSTSTSHGEGTPPDGDVTGARPAQGPTQGSLDDICPLKALRAFYAALPEPRELVVIDGANHLFEGRTPEVGEALEDLLADFNG